MTGPEILVVCTHNAGRSVAARVLLDHHGQGRVTVRSAGSAPGDDINPAVTLARTLSDTFAGIEPASAPAFVVAQLVGAGLAVGAVRVLYPHIAEAADDVLMPHPTAGGRAPGVPRERREDRG